MSAPLIETPVRQLSLQVFGFALKWWLFISITILIPLDFLYRYYSLFNDLNSIQLLKNLLSIVLFSTTISIFIALISLILYIFYRNIFSNNTEFINKANFYSGLIFITIELVFYGAQWVKLVFHIPFYLINYKLRILILFIAIICLSLLIIIYYNKINLIYIELKSISQRLFKFNFSIIILCMVILLITTLTPYNNGKTKTDFFITNNNRLSISYPNIILITFDALPAQYLSFYGYERKTSPNLEDLIKVSYVFSNMYAASNWTLPSIASLMTGKYPSNHNVNRVLSYLSTNNSNQNLSMVLRELGYETAAVWSNWNACPWRVNLRSFSRIIPRDFINEFLFYVGLETLPYLDEIIDDSPFSRIKNYLLEWLQYNEIDFLKKPEFSFSKATEILPELSQPFFLWIHIWPPHDPYLPDARFLYSILKEKIFDNKSVYVTPPFQNPYPPQDQINIDKLALRFEENIRYADHEFGRFLSFLHEKKLFNNSIIIVSSDHGEMFAKGWWRHGGPYLYQPLIHIPLIIHLPGQFQGEWINANVSIVDVAPTILDILDVKPPRWMDGKSFKEAFQNSNFDTGTKFSMQLGYVCSTPTLKSRSVAAIKGKYKLIKYLDWDRFELYDVRNDPQEQLNLIASKPEIFSELKGEIDQALGK